MRTKQNKISLDVDGCLFQVDKKWCKWLEMVTKTKLSTNPWDMNNAPYDLTTLFKDELAREGLTGFEFWDQDNLYDNHVDTVEGAVEACDKLASMGFILTPVTKVYWGHAQSKANLLKKHFPMLQEMVGISMVGDKSVVQCGYIIDDRLCNFSGFEKPTQGVLLTTPYKQKVKHVDINYVVCDTWSQITQHFEETYYE